MMRCTDCGSWGHRKGLDCPYYRTMQKQDPYGINPPRPTMNASAIISDPALREATERTAFLDGMGDIP